MDTLQNYLNNPQVQARMYNQPQQQAYNPITAGSLAGMESARRSLDMDAQERQRAMGLAIARFGAGLSQPGHGPGFAGALSAVNANIHPAMQSYIGEEDKVADMKAYLLKQQLELERHKRAEDYKRERNKIEDQFMKQKLGIMEKNTRFSKDAAKELMVSQMEDKLKAEGKIPANALLKARMTNGERNEVLKDQRKIVKSGEYASKSAEALDTMEKIFEQHPDLWNSLPLLIHNKGKRDETVFNQYLKGLSVDKQKALQILDKELNTVVDLKLEQGGGRQTDIRKKIIVDMMPTGQMHPDVALKVIKQMKKRDLYDKYKGEETKKAIAGQYDIQFPSYDEYISQHAKPEPEDTEGNSGLSALSDDDLDKEIMSLQGG